MNIKEYQIRQNQFEILDALGIVVWKERDQNLLPLGMHETCNHRETRINNKNDFNKMVNELVDHSSVHAHQSNLISYVQKLNTRCWVLLQSTLENPECLTILEGMLKVLNLNVDSYSTSSIREPDINKVEGIHLLNSLMTWCPETVLVLGSELGRILEQAKETLAFPLPFTLKVTYHPNELFKEPQKKKQAYRELLELKEVLDNHKIVRENNDHNT